MSDWFLAHKDGLRQVAERLVERRGFGIVAGELYQNVMDTNAARCDVTITKTPGRPTAALSVTDDDPEGFPDLAHAYTMFAPSLKKGDPTKAGRFNVGEKMVLSFCRSATISTTKGTVEFDDDGRHEYPRRKREVGTEFRALIDCTAERFDQFITYCNRILVRPGLILTVNGQEIPTRDPIRVFSAKLATEIASDDGLLRKSVRLTGVQVFGPASGETAMLYELGIPVVETGDHWHVNVMQKVPLNVDRDNVTPAYLRDLRVAVFNQMHEQISEDDTTATWVNEATSDGNCEPDAAETFRVKRYGEKSVAFDPSNPEANAEAAGHGYTVIPSRGLTPGQRSNLYSAGTLQTTSAAFPLAGKGAYSDDPNAKPVEVIPYDQWTEGMRSIQEYTQGVAKRLLGKAVQVQFVTCRSFVGKPWEACFGRGHNHNRSFFDYNVHCLGKRWFEGGVTERVDDLILHELAHEYESNHLSESYYRACTKLGARLKAEALKDPEWFGRFAPEAAVLQTV